MPKYLARGYYGEEGVKGLLKDGGTKRREAVKKAIESLGGTLEAFYYAFGDTDLFVIVDFPDHVSATAASLVINSSGTVKSNLTVLVTPEEIDTAAQKTVAYTPPGE